MVVDGYVSDPIAIDNGIGQGDPLSMVLYQYYNADLLDIPSSKDEEAVAYVDDAFMMATGTDFQSAHRVLADMMCKEGGVEDWSKTHSSPLEYTKLALMNFAHSCKKSNNPTLHLPRRSIQPVDSAKYLGVVFDRNLNWKVQQAHAVEKGTKWAAQIRRLARLTWGITPKYARRLFISVALPRMLYAIDVWYTPSSVEHADTRAIGTAKVTKQVETVQRAGALAITGGLRTSPTDALNASAYLLPASLTINRWCHRAYTRMAMLPPEHPLYKPVNWKRTRATTRHRGPLHKLTSAYNLDTPNVEKIPAVARDPTVTGKLPFQISIPENKESSARAAENAIEEIQVFTDGSAQGGKVGAAAILIRKNSPNRILHFHLGPEAEHTVHEAELVGLLLAIHLISTEKRAAKTCSIAVDNQAAIRAFDSDMRRPGHHLAREVLKIANRMQKRKNMRGYKLTIRWTAGHSGIMGNERADSEAKKAASGKHTENKHLPVYLRKPLPINPAALKRSHGDALKKRWKADWTASPRGKEMLRIDNTTPSTKFLKTISSTNLSRSAASKIAQLRLRHIPLNGYLYRFKRTDKASCPACGADVESVAHYLLNCPMYAHERWALARQVKRLRKNMTLETLLGEPELAVPLAKYIDSTGRFKINEGEQSHTTNNDTAREPLNR
jgi:ribonuclease HI